MTPPTPSNPPGMLDSAAERRLRAMLEASGAAVIALDLEFRVADLTRAAAALLGVEAGEAAGLHLARVVSGWTAGDVESLRAAGAWRGALAPNLAAADARIEAEIVPVDGGPGYVMAIREEAPAAGGGQGEAARAAIARAAHDLRNPLTAVRGQAQLLRRRITRDGRADPERTLAGVEAIEDAAGRLAELIDQLAAEAAPPADTGSRDAPERAPGTAPASGSGS